MVSPYSSDHFYFASNGAVD